MVAAAQKREKPTVIFLKFESSVFRDLLKITTDPKTGLPYQQGPFAEECKRVAAEMGIEEQKVKFSQKTISNWANGVFTPDLIQAMVMGKILGVVFVADWGKFTQNADTMQKLKAPHLKKRGA
jgi:hypothetical protein